MATANTPSALLSQTMGSRPMTVFQWRAIGLCCLINMLDGFDVMVMAFTAASVTAHWALTGTQLGYLLSAGLVGMTAGSFLIAPWADRFGRRPVVLLCVALVGFGMICSSQAQTPMQLAALRFVTGLGIGGILASSYVIAGEYASDRWRSLAISVQATAYALGATLGGLATAKVIGAVGWQSVFLYGGIVTLATLPVLFAWLPESLDFYLSRRPAGALAGINHILRRVGIPTLETLPSEGQGARTNMRRSIAYLLSPAMRRATILIWVSFFLIMFGFYFVMSWSPRLLVATGLTNEQGITGGVLLNLGGIIGTALLGLLAARLPLFKVHFAYLIATALLMSLLLSLAGEVGQTLTLAFFLGVFVNGCVAGMFSTTPMVYEPSHRVTGLGWGIGMGRLGSILAPLAAGPLVDATWRPDQIYTLYAAAFALAAVTVVLLHYAVQRRNSGPAAEPPLHQAGRRAI
ncbi:MFS transporter [Pigmentiphaga litoralis]|uniref:Benzoate transport n=1 Tax=Pigmentiphaga litoralis TaxID=516702 RepID=A0A7Y9ISW2_9BURK|nr:MFS transporter [Pigmentiphaga litoralis]NYE23919.1 benzoate transport [Pigmentiphaga litoralis]NYE82467.1 benzoate transport [Pigmentiphaga litoralis]